MLITDVKLIELLLENNVAERYQQLNVDDCPHSLFKSLVTRNGPSYCPCSIDLYDCNMTAGLEAKMCLALGAQVMLRHNLDTKAGLVNGAIGTVLFTASNHVTLQFDHVSTPYDVERVKSKFMVMKNFYV